MSDGRVRIEAVRAVRSACRAMEEATGGSVPSDSEEKGAVLLDGMMTIFEKSNVDFGEAVLILKRGEALVPFYLNTGEIKIMEEDEGAEGPVQFVVEIETGQQFDFGSFMDMMEDTKFAFSFEVAKPSGERAQIRVQNLRIYGGSLDGQEDPDQSIYGSTDQDPYTAPQPMYNQQQPRQQPAPRQQPPQQQQQQPRQQPAPRQQPPQQQQQPPRQQPQQQPPPRQQQPRQQPAPRQQPPQPQQQPPRQQQPPAQDRQQNQLAREQQRAENRKEQAQMQSQQLGEVELHKRREYSGPGW